MTTTPPPQQKMVPVYSVAPWDRSWVRPGFGFKHWFQDKNGGEGYGMGRDRQWDYQVSNASPEAVGRIANSIGESTPWCFLSDQDGATLGPLRYAAGTLAGFLSWMAQTQTASMETAFGVEGTRLLKSKEWILENNPDQNQGHGLTRFDWFRRGVYLSARAPWWQRGYLQYYDDNVLDDAKQAFAQLNAKTERTLAMLARSRNSSKTAMNRVRDAYRANYAATGSEARAIEAGAAAYTAMNPGLYGGRVKKLFLVHGLGPAPVDPRFSRDLAIDGAPMVRQDGQVADTVGESSGSLPWVVALALLALHFWK